MGAMNGFDALVEPRWCRRRRLGWLLGKQGPELLGTRRLDRDIQELVYRPTLHG